MEGGALVIGHDTGDTSMGYKGHFLGSFIVVRHVLPIAQAVPIGYSVST